MIPELRKKYNETYNESNYISFLNEINAIHQPVLFRLAETPIFVPRFFTDQMIDACESIVDIILGDDFKEKTKNAVPKNYTVKNENNHPHCIAFDFGICKNEKGELEPQLIEMQGFPSLFAYEILVDEIFAKHFDLPDGFSSYLSKLDKESYITLLKEMIIGDIDPKNVILLEIFPHKQKTNIDFYCTKEYLGIEIVCITELVKEGSKLYYNLNGVKTEVKRIYNRVIFDELSQQEEGVQEKAKILFEDLDVQWVPHPNWFYRISKYTLPLIDHPNIPKTYYLNELESIPRDLENYVLKPLFSFAGQGVVIDVTPQDIEKIEDPENWILQRKVNYAAVIDTPDEPAKAEIRIFYFWKDGASRPIPTNNLARLSKGKMIGVRYNKDRIWTGGSYCLFEQ